MFGPASPRLITISAIAFSGLGLLCSTEAFASPGCTAANAGALNYTDTSGGSYGATVSGFAIGDKLTLTFVAGLLLPPGNFYRLANGATTVFLLSDSPATPRTYTITGNNGDTSVVVGVINGTVTVTCTPAASPTSTINNDSQNLRTLQIAATRFAADTSGNAITGAVDSAIDDAFAAGGGAPIIANPNGVRFNFAAEPETKAPAQEPFQALAYAPRYTKEPLPTFEQLWSAWADVRGTGFDRTDSTGEHGSQLNVTAGFGRKLTPDFLVGMFGGYENFLFTMSSIAGRMTGEGETVGGYTAWRFAEHWRIDGKLGWTSVSYNGTAGTASGSFNGARWLGSGGLTGTYRLAGWMFEPSARIYTLWEHDDAFTDTLGTSQASRNFSESRVSTGAKVAYPWMLNSGLRISPYVGTYGDYRFSTDSALPVAAPFVGIKDGWSARVTSGLAFAWSNNALLSLGGELGGLGAGYEIWSANARLSWPF
jgi:hypothetical protein